MSHKDLTRLLPIMPTKVLRFLLSNLLIVALSIISIFTIQEASAQQGIEDDKICILMQRNIDDGTILFSQGDFDKAIVQLNQAINRGANDSCPNLLIEAYSVQAQIYSLQKNYSNSITGYLAAITIAEKIKSDGLLSELYVGIADDFFMIPTYEKAAEYYKKAVPLLIQQNNKSQQFYTLENLGVSLIELQQPHDALKVFEEILAISQAEPNSLIRTRTLYRMSEIYRLEQEWVNAITVSQQLYKERLDGNDFLGATLALNNRAYSEIQMQDLTSAINTLNNALTLAKEHQLSPSVVAGIYTNLGICYQNQGLYNSSLSSLSKATENAQKTSDFSQLSDIHNTTAWVQYHKGDLYNASRFARLAIDEAKKANDPVALSNSYHTYSQFLRDGNDYINALDYYEKYSFLRDSLELGKRLEQEKQQQLSEQIERTEREQRLYLADKEMQNLMIKQLSLEAERQKQENELLKKERELEQSEKDKAYQNLMLSKREQEAALQLSTIRNLEQENSIKELQIRQKDIEEQQREKDIALLQSEKERQQLQIEKETETRKRAIWMLVLSILVLIIVISGLVTTRKKNQLLANQKRQIEEKNTHLENANTEISLKNVQLSEFAEEIQSQNEEIIVQRDMIEARNQDIMASIQYARLIQNAVLPNDSVLQNGFANHFVLYKPRDIVSGDFWWFNEYENRKIVVVADCTGHGVPGAFLSMLGSTLLSEIVAHQPQVKANILLDKLRAKMRETMMHGQTDSLQLDGMDLAVCIYDEQNREVEIAGAYNPVYIVRNGDIEIIKTDKIPIGLGGNPDSTYKLNIWKAEPKDRFFMFSDGYADQFGGEFGRKLMVKNFRELLVKSSNMPMTEQKKFLNKSFVEWQGNQDQIDDVLVLGFET